MPDDAAPDPTTPAPAPIPGGDDPADPFAEVLAAGSQLDAFDDAARVEAWASSALGVWAEAPDAADHDEEFCAWLAEVAETGDPRARQARLVRAAIMALLPGGEDPAGGDTPADDLSTLEAPPAWLGHLGTAAPTRAWRVERHGVESLGVGFVSSDGSEHSVLADVVDGELAALIVAPGPDELFDGSEDLIAPEPLGIAEAAERIVAAWRQLHRQGTETPESVHVNGALARARLTSLTGDRLDDLRVSAESARDPAPPPERSDGVGSVPVETAEERAETDRWACSVLDGAIGPEREAPPSADDTLVDAVLEALLPERIETQPALEREAYGALEWADWLGVVIEAVRSGPGTPLDPDAMVDAVNRCPEVTSSIPRSDRSYYAWAFSLLLALWRRAGVVDEVGRLTPAGVVALPVALRRAWGQVSPG